MADPAPVPVSKLEDNYNAIKFSDVCLLLERLGKTQGSANKLKLLFNKELKVQLQGQSIFPLLRLLLPLNDTERGKYGLKQASIAKTYVSALHLDKNSDDAQRLMNWKDPTKNQGIELAKMISGDFGLILEDVLRSRVRADCCDLTVGQANELLSSLANAITADDKIAIIKNQVLNNFNALEQKWLMRIVFQDLKIGLKHENVLAAFYPTALKRYNECTNLRMVCEEESTSKSLVGVQLFIHFSPMLAKGFPNSAHGQVQTVEAALGKQPFVMDLKLDGERTLIHIGEDNSFVMYTRKGNDYTENYWPVAHDVIACLRDKGTFSVILDGEICALDGRTKELIPFGKNLGVAKLEREYGANKQEALGWHTDLPSWMCFIAFDLVYLDGEGAERLIQDALTACGVVMEATKGEISQLPLVVRRRLLADLLRPQPHRVEIVQYKYVLSDNIDTRRSELADYFEAIVQTGKEGLVVKSLAAPYVLGEKSRSSAHWMKMKPEYGDSLEDLDVLVLAAYYGEGQNMRGEGLSTFLCGLLDDTNTFQTFAKVGTGYSFVELAELRERLRPHCIPWDSKTSPPVHLAHWKITKRDDRPDVYILPQHSVVLQLRCAEVVPSTGYSAGYTCRFPRVARIRYDKAYNDVLRLRDLTALQHRPRMRIVRDKDDDEEKEHKKMKQHTVRLREQRVDAQFTLQASKRIAQEGRIFAGKVYCVLESDFTVGARKYTREELIESIRRQGGEIVANASFPKCQVIAGAKRSIQLKNLIASGKTDVLDFNYILSCLETGYCLPARAHDFLGLSAATRESFRNNFDLFGDSYTEEVSVDVLQKILSTVDSSVLGQHPAAQAAAEHYALLRKMTWREILQDELDYEERLPLDNLTTCLFQPSVAIYLDIYAELGPVPKGPNAYIPALHPVLSSGRLLYMQALACRLRSRGAVIALHLHSAVSHIVLCAHEANKDVIRSRLRVLRLVDEGGCEKRIVRETWAEACLIAQQLLVPDADMIVPLT